jgi:hypothetical protein
MLDSLFVIDADWVGREFWLDLFTQNNQRMGVNVFRTGNIVVKGLAKEEVVFLKNFDGYVLLSNDCRLDFVFFSKQEKGIFVSNYKHIYRENVKQIKSKHFEHSLDELDLEFFN